MCWRWGAAPVALAEGAEPVTLTVWLNHTWYPTDKFEGIIPDVIKEKTGVTLEPTRAVDESQLGLMIASGEMPDLIFTDKELSRLSSADLCYSYSELIEKYCPEWTPSKTAIVNASSYSTDGDYYFLFSHGFTTEEWQKAAGGVPSTGSLVYRADIAQKLGFDATQFTTMEELDALYAAVHAAYPELEMLTYGSVTGLGYFLSQYGMTTLTDWVEAADGTYQHMIDSANYEQMMRKLNGYFRLGYINPDSFAYDEATSDGMMYTGKSFSYLNATQGLRQHHDLDGPQGAQGRSAERPGDEPTGRYGQLQADQPGLVRHLHYQKLRQPRGRHPADAVPLLRRGREADHVGPRGHRVHAG